MKEKILSQLSPEYPWKDRFTWFSTIDSTNDRLKALAREGAPHGTVLIADRQTGGHGRLGRSFHSPEGVGVYLSILLRPQCNPMDLMHLTCATAVAMADAVEQAAGQVHQVPGAALGPQEDAEIDADPLRGMEAAAQTAMASRLLIGHQHGAVGSALSCQGFQTVIGGINGGKPGKPVLPGVFRG